MKFLSFVPVWLFAFALVSVAAPPKVKATPKPAPSLKPADETPGAAGAPVIKRLKAEVTAPIYIKQAAGMNTLANVTVTATAAPAAPDQCGVLFVPTLGEVGKATLGAVTKLLMSVHHGWPPGHRIEITFKPEIAADDAPASALAIALLLDSMIAGWESDPGCSIIGGLQPDGKIQGATSALMRLTTASRGSASRILMPEKNVTQASDCLVNEGIAGTGRVQMFAVKDFDEVLQMAAAKPDPDMAKSIELFNEVQKLLSAAGADSEAILKKTDVQEGLRFVLRKWPNHMTARLLLGRATGRYKTFSLPSSVEAVDRIAATLLRSIQSAKPHAVKGLAAETVVDELKRLRLATERLDPQARKYVQAVIKYGEAAQIWLSKPAHDPAETNDLVTALSASAAQALDARGDLGAAIQQVVR